MMLKEIKYVSTPDKYDINIICNSTTFIISIDKSIILEHLYSFDESEILEELGCDSLSINSVDLSYSVSRYNKRDLSIIIRFGNHGTFSIAEFDIEDSKLLPTISVCNSLG